MYNFTSKIKVTRERTDEFESITIEITQLEQQRENRLEKNKQTLSDLWDYNKRFNIHWSH